MSDPGGYGEDSQGESSPAQMIPKESSAPVDRGTVREQAARMIAETRCKAYAECMDHRYGPCPAHIEDAEDDAKALSHARLLRDDESLETENILGMMWQREKRRAASAEAERDRLRAGIEQLCKFGARKFWDDRDSTVEGDYVRVDRLRALLAEETE